MAIQTIKAFTTQPGEIAGLTEKTSLVTDDVFLIEDSAAANADKKVKPYTIATLQNGDSAGMLTVPTITDNTDGTIQVTSIEVLIRSTSDHSGGVLYRKTIAQNLTLALTNNSINYIYVDWNSGTPIYKATANRALINNSDIIPVYRIYLSSNAIEYKLSYGATGCGNSAKNFDRVMRIRGSGGIERESGFTITESATRIINIQSGYVWFGLERISLDTIVQGGGGVTTQLWYHSSGNWTETALAAYNNTQYDNGTNLATLTSNRYAVNWIFRNVVTNEIDVVLGNGDYTLAQADASTIPSLPTQITNFYLLCGRIIVKKSSDTATSIENVIDKAYQNTIISEHNDLGAIDGGTSGQYYHLTTTEHTAATKTDLNTRTIIAQFGNGIDVIEANTVAELIIPYACTLNSWKIVSINASSSIVIDVWRKAFASYPPTNSDSITNSHEPTLSSAQSASDDSITDWTSTAILANDVLRFNVDSCTTATKVTLIIKATL